MPFACYEIVWLRRVFSELGFLQSSPAPLHVDNTSAIQITENPIFHEQTKHIQVDCHSIQEAYNDHIIPLPRVYGSSECRYLHQGLIKNSSSILSGQNAASEYPSINLKGGIRANQAMEPNMVHDL